MANRRPDRQSNKVPDKAVAPARSANVGFTRPEVTALRPLYDMIRDVLAGEHAVKARGDYYLPRPNSSDKSAENKARYDAYLKRAKFYGATKRTLAGMIGQIFMRDPVVENLPTLLDPLKTDMTGSGITLDQMATMMVAKAIAFGRLGLFIDYPNTDVPATVAAIASGKVRPSTLVFNPWEVINWRTVVIDGKEVFSLVVIYETVTTDDDGFEMKSKEQWRVLSLENDPLVPTNTALDTTLPLGYRVELYEYSAEGFVISETYRPCDSKGVQITSIPFMFVGSNNNDATPDDPPLYDLASMNIGHYCNSADYEEAVFLTGQPTPYFAGLTESWVKEVWKGKMFLGSRSAITLPQGATAGLLQAKENTMPKEAMDMKERQMVALGARLVQQQAVQRTATEAGQEETSNNSVLATVATNVELGIEFALRWNCTFVGVEVVEGDGAINYELNTQFDLMTLDPLELQQLIAVWQDQGITTTEFRANLRRAGIAMLDDAAYATQKTKEEGNGTAPKPPVAPGTDNTQPPKNKQVVPGTPAA